MKNSPNCGEILGDSVKECFKCHYNYGFGRVLTSLEISEQRKIQENSVRAKAEREQYIQQHKSLQLEKNPLFSIKQL